MRTAIILTIHLKSCLVPHVSILFHSICEQPEFTAILDLSNRAHPKSRVFFYLLSNKDFLSIFSNKSYKRERNISYDRDSLISYWITTWAHCLIFNFWVTKTHRQLGKSNFVSIIKVLKVWRSGLVWTPYSFSYFNNYSYWYFIKANIFFVKVQIKIWIK